jgi:hypothetical protein
MKKLNSLAVPMVVAIAFACVLSCSEQDEMPVVNNSNQGQSPNTLNTKTRTSGRVGGETFNSAVGDPIDLATAKAWAANYREKNPGDTKGHFFGFEIIQQILSEAGCVGIRIYYALDEQGEKKLLIVGVDAEGNDLLPSGGEMMMDGGGENTIADYSFPCPNHCPEEEL